MNESKRRKILLIIGIITLLVAVIGAAYAYLTAQIGAGASADVIIQADTIDSLQFTTGNPISIDISQDNFVSGGNNKVANTTATATLIAGTNRTPSLTYNVYLKITSTFKYTTSDNKPELILKVTSPENTAITSIEGLTYNAELGGFDVTETSGLIQIAKDYTITTSTTKRQNWKVEIEVINLESNQKENAGHEFSAKLKIQQEEFSSFANYIKGLYTTNGENGLYLHNSSLPNGAGDNALRYAGSNELVHNYVCFASDAEECPYDNLYRIVGVFDNQVKLIKADVANKDILGEDGDFYNYTDNRNVYPSYKGEFTEFNNYYFNYVGLEDKTINNNWGSNDWESSLFNKVNLNINYIEYLNNINPKWSKMIADTYWNIGAHTTHESTAKAFYSAEKETQTSKPSKIGLMYASDYGYSIPSNNWTTNLSNYSNSTQRTNHWMDIGIKEWTITPKLNNLYTIYRVNHTGILFYDYGSYGAHVRPVFYLKSFVEYVGGEGTKTSPYRIA